MTLPVANDTIMVNEELHLDQIAQVLNMPIQLLRDMNPQYKTDVIPAAGGPYSVRLPLELTSRFIDLQDSIFAYKDLNSLHGRTTPCQFNKICLHCEIG
jgi:membrane-bound lytic murein transglycosylase D